MTKALQLQDKVAVITGAASGIGRATVQAFAEEGARIVAADINAQGLSELGTVAGVHTIVADVSKQCDVDRMIDAAVERYGRLDLLCNVAGIMDRLLPVTEVTDEVWQRVLGINLTAPFMTSRRAIPVMLKNGGGSIINIASVGGLSGGRSGAAYAASKHGLIGLTKNTACCYGSSGIRCVAICPGPVETAIGLGGQPSEIGMSVFGKTAAAMPRVAKPVEIAKVVLFAASDAASFVNGAVLVVDGGWTAY
jgi:NAD(P)-dependent dehydrogenase (short-subunit alcohol dehydrogenase family)